MRERFLCWLRRRWLLVLVIIASAVLLILRFDELRQFCNTLFQGRWEWIALAILLQLIYYGLLGLLYQLAFAIVHVQSHLRELIPTLFASIFVTTLAPTGGVSGAALFVDDAARRGQSAARATEGVLLVWVAQNVALLPVLFLGIAHLLARNALQTYQIVGTAIFVLFVSCLTALLLLGRSQGLRIRALLEWVQRRVNGLAHLLRRPYFLPHDWARLNAAEFCDASTAIATRPQLVGYTLVLALAHTLVNVASVFAIFLAYHQPVAIGTVAAGFALGIAFAVISVLPLDVALVQGVMGLVYVSLGVPTAIAVAVALVFGGINTWLPLAIGFFLLREVRAFGGGAR